MSVWRTSIPGVSFSDRDDSLWLRVKAHWQIKLLLTATLNALFWTGYAFLSRHTFFPVHSLPVMWLDAAVKFQPVWGWIYLTEFGVTGTVPWLIVSTPELRRYVIGLLFLSLTSFLIFLVFPVASPRPPVLPVEGPVAMIVRLDGTYNAFPSLHAGFLVYTLALGLRLFGRRLHPLVVAGIGIWTALILYATLATKQHYVLDLLAGGMIGFVAHGLAWRLQPRTS